MLDGLKWVAAGALRGKRIARVRVSKPEALEISTRADVTRGKASETGEDTGREGGVKEGE